MMGSCGHPNYRLRLTLLMLIIPVLFLLSLVHGSAEIPLSGIVNILSGKGAADPSWSFIVLETRLPRAITALLAGAPWP
jgi:iron complex transport system permease protein